MDAILWFVLIMLGAIIAMSALGTDIQQFLYRNSRIKKCTGNARDNVRIVHSVTSTKYKPLEVEPLGTNRWKVIVSELQPPFEPQTLEVSRENFKSDLIATIINGRSDIRYTPDDLLSGGDRNVHQLYTPDEERKITQSTDQKITELEGKVSAGTANQRQNMEDAVRHAGDLAKSGKAPQTRR